MMHTVLAICALAQCMDLLVTMMMMVMMKEMKMMTLLINMSCMCICVRASWRAVRAVSTNALMPPLKLLTRLLTGPRTHLNNEQRQ